MKWQIKPLKILASTSQFYGRQENLPRVQYNLEFHKLYEEAQHPAITLNQYHNEPWVKQFLF